MPYSTGRKLLAWCVHIFTASGVIVGLLALAAIVNHNYRAAFLWLFIAVLIDTVDGTLARITLNPPRPTTMPSKMDSK